MEDRRVLLLSNLKRNVALEPLMLALRTGNYKTPSINRPSDPLIRPSGTFSPVGRRRR